MRPLLTMVSPEPIQPGCAGMVESRLLQCDVQVEQLHIHEHRSLGRGLWNIEQLWIGLKDQLVEPVDARAFEGMTFGLDVVRAGTKVSARVLNKSGWPAPFEMTLYGSADRSLLNRDEEILDHVKFALAVQCGCLRAPCLHDRIRREVREAKDLAWLKGSP